MKIDLWSAALTMAVALLTFFWLRQMRRLEILDRRVSPIVELMHAWVATWGQPPETVALLLQDLVRDRKV